MSERRIEVDGRRLKVTNWEKVFYPATGFTKGELIEYYREISPVLLPHLKDRPLTLRRFPHGIGDDGFWSKQAPPGHPDWVGRTTVWSEHRGAEMQYVMANDLSTLLWAVNLSTVELHVPLAFSESLEHPTFLAFDLDPGAPADLLDCCEVALGLRELFTGLGCESFAKTSGSKGLQVYVPLNTGDVTYDDTKTFARALAQAYEAHAPGLVVSSMRKSLRKGKVLIDWSQNDEHKTTVCVYSVRAREKPGVSTPVTWDEVAATAESGQRARLAFTPSEALQRVEEHGDLFAPVLDLQQALPTADSIPG